MTLGLGIHDCCPTGFPGQKAGLLSDDATRNLRGRSATIYAMIILDRIILMGVEKKMFEFIVGGATVVIAITVADIYLRLNNINKNIAIIVQKLDETGNNGKHWDDTARHLQHIRELIWVQLSDQQKRNVQSIPYLR